MAGTCPSCGSPLSHHDRHIRFRLPDPVIEVPEEERAERLWGNDVMLAVKDLGSFVRALLPVHLDDGGSLTFGLWLGVHPDTLRHRQRGPHGPSNRDGEVGPSTHPAALREPSVIPVTRLGAAECPANRASGAPATRPRPCRANYAQTVRAGQRP